MAKEVPVEQAYKQAVEERIKEYVLLHGKEDCTVKQIASYVADGEKVQATRRVRNFDSDEDAYSDDPDKKPNEQRYVDTVKSALKRLVKKGYLIEDTTSKRTPKYTQVEPKPRVISLRNEGVVFFRVKDGKEDIAKKIIEANIKDSDIIVIPLNGYLMCVMGNTVEYNLDLPQTTYIREQVEQALEMAECELYVLKESENNVKKEVLKKGSLKELLGNDYTYYWFDQQVKFQNNDDHKRRILMIECNREVADLVYDKIVANHSSLFTTIYWGFGGMMIVFNIEESERKFEEFIKYIKKYPKDVGKLGSISSKVF